MDLKTLRQYLDTLDTAIKYILVQRMSIMPLVAEYKIENNLPIYQPNREGEMYEKMREFSAKTGLNPELIPEVYKLIIGDSVRIQNQIKEEGKVPSTIKEISSNEEELMQKSLERLKDFIELMNEIKNTGLENDNRIIENFTCFYKEKSLE